MVPGNFLASILSPYTPLRLPRGLVVRNRFAVAPMTTWSSLPDGNISPDELPYLERRARGGFGMVITAACCVHPSGWAFDGQWQCSSDEFLPSLKKVADAIHAGGSTAVLQIHHGGRQCPPALCGGTPISASAVPSTREGAPVPREMTEAEIREIIAAFAAAALRAKQTGYDGVEIHGANTYLIQQFVSPHSNRRKDVWGQNPFKFALELTDAVLEAVGDDFPVGYRFSPEEPETPGIRISLTEGLVSRLCERPLSYLSLSLREYAQRSLHNEFERPTLSRLAGLVDGRIPFMGVGAVKTEEDALNAMVLGADLVAVGKVAISDPEWPRGLAEGRPPVTRVPRKNMAERVTLPAVLAAKIDANNGWFDVDEEA